MSDMKALAAMWRREEEWAIEVSRQAIQLQRVRYLAEQLHQWIGAGDVEKLSQLADELLEASVGQ